jgi:alpha-tubulin suppressor-like RCC1 family protein
MNSKKELKFYMLFEDYIRGYNVLIVTKDDKTYVNEMQIVKELCEKQIIDFANGFYHCIARNSSGKVYCWGYNYRGFLGIGPNYDSKPILDQYLNNEFFIDMSCGAFHSLMLTNYGEVYALGSNSCGQSGNGCNDYQLIPIKVKGFYDERVVMISCGLFH